MVKKSSEVVGKPLADLSARKRASRELTWMQTIARSGCRRVTRRLPWQSRAFFGIPDLSSLSPFPGSTSGDTKQTYDTQKALP